MKLLSFIHNKKPGWGAVIQNNILNLTNALDDAPTIKCALSKYSLKEIEKASLEGEDFIKFEDVSYLPVIPNTDRIFCIGLNYDEHRREANREKTLQPTVFLRFGSSQVGHAESIVLPSESEELDFEGEIAIVIGKSGRRISEENAWEYIAGYAPYNDASIRDWQRHTTQWTPGKNFPATGGFGPFMVTRGEISDDQELKLTTRLNGEVMQSSTTSHLIFSIPKLINYISIFTQLEVGDVIVTGTPGGVGFKRNPPLFMKSGDTVEVEISGVATLMNTVKKEVK